MAGSNSGYRPVGPPGHECRNMLEVKSRVRSAKGLQHANDGLRWLSQKIILAPITVSAAGVKGTYLCPAKPDPLRHRSSCVCAVGRVCRIDGYRVAASLAQDMSF